LVNWLLLLSFTNDIFECRLNLAKAFLEHLLNGLSHNWHLGHGLLSEFGELGSVLLLLGILGLFLFLLYSYLSSLRSGSLLGLLGTFFG
jgi:hypothetical protein